MFCAEACSKQKHARLDLFQDSLISGGVFAIGICDAPVFDGRGKMSAPGGVENDVELARQRLTGKVDDEVGVFHGVAAERLGRKAFDGIAVGEKSLLGGFGDVAEREETGAGRFNDVGGVTAGNGFGHGAATGVADADKEDAAFLGGQHRRIVEKKFQVVSDKSKVSEKRNARPTLPAKPSGTHTARTNRGWGTRPVDNFGRS